jgi:hypothetical protein
LVNVATLFWRSTEFRHLLGDFLDIVKEVFQTGLESVERVTENITSEPSIDKQLGAVLETPVEPSGEQPASSEEGKMEEERTETSTQEKLKRAAEGYVSEPLRRVGEHVGYFLTRAHSFFSQKYLNEDQVNRMLDRLKRVVLDVQANDAYRQAMQHLMAILGRTYQDTMSAVAEIENSLEKEVPSTQQDDEARQHLVLVRQNAKALAEHLANGRSLDDLFAAAQKLFTGKRVIFLGVLMFRFVE